MSEAKMEELLQTRQSSMLGACGWLGKASVVSTEVQEKQDQWMPVWRWETQGNSLLVLEVL